jgi:protease-4
VVSSGIFMMGLIGLAASAGDASEPPPVTIWGSESAESTIVSIPVTGPILGRSESGGSLFGQGAYGYDVAAELDAVGKDDAVAVVLEMDTPGGTIYGSKAIADAVVRYQKRTGHKVVAFVRGMSASGGMYAMAPCDEVLVDHGTIVGSVGVIMGPFSRYKDVTAVDGGLLAGGVTTTGGVTQEYFTRGKGKDLGNPFRDITPEEREVLNGWMDTEYDNFVNHVAKYREIPAEKIKSEYGAYVFGPAQAIENGYADSEMGQEEAYRHIGELAGVDPDDTRVVTSSESGFLSALMGGSSSVEPGDAELAAAREQASATIRASALCVGSATVLAVHGDLARYCDD